LYGVISYLGNLQALYVITSYIVIFLVPLFYVLKPKPNSYYILETMGLFYVVYLPAVSLFFNVDEKYGVVLLSVVSVIFLIPESWKKLPPPESCAGTTKSRQSILLISLIITLLSLLIKPLGELTGILFYALFALNIVCLEHLLQKAASQKSLLFFSLIFFMIFAYYSLNVWGGYGRLLMGSMIAVFFALLHHYERLKVHLIYVVIAGPALIYTGHIIRYGTSVPLELHSGSVGSPIFNSMDLISDAGHRVIYGFSGLFEQAQLFYLSWVPRALWDSKPVGLGYSLVDEYLGRVGVSDGHSTAPGIVGEAAWFLGDYFMIGVAFSVAVFFLGRFFIVRLPGGMVAPILFFDVFLGNVFWGGMASAGARIWFFVFPALIAILFLKFLSRSSGKNKSGTQAKKYSALVDSV
jgi:hypothetical protein